MIRKVEAVGNDPQKPEVREQIKRAIAGSVECGLEHIRLRSVVAQSPEALFWNEDDHGVDDIGIKINADGTVSEVAPVPEKAAARIPSSEEILNPKRTKEELMALAVIHKIPAEAMPANLSGKLKPDIAAFFDGYFHPKKTGDSGVAAQP